MTSGRGREASGGGDEEKTSEERSGEEERGGDGGGRRARLGEGEVTLGSGVQAAPGSAPLWTQRTCVHRKRFHTKRFSEFSSVRLSDGDKM